MNWYLWRPVLAGLCTRPDLRGPWTLRDLVEAHSVLDAREAIEVLADEAAKAAAQAPKRG